MLLKRASQTFGKKREKYLPGRQNELSRYSMYQELSNWYLTQGHIQEMNYL